MATFLASATSVRSICPVRSIDIGPPINCIMRAKARAVGTAFESPVPRSPTTNPNPCNVLVSCPFTRQRLPSFMPAARHVGDEPTTNDVRAMKRQRRRDMLKSFRECGDRRTLIFNSSERLNSVEPPLEPTSFVSVTQVAPVVFSNFKINQVFTEHNVVGADVLNTANPRQRGFP